jgi:hypothetical protein
VRQQLQFEVRVIYEACLGPGRLHQHQIGGTQFNSDFDGGEIKVVMDVERLSHTLSQR